MGGVGPSSRSTHGFGRIISALPGRSSRQDGRSVRSQAEAEHRGEYRGKRRVDVAIMWKIEEKTMAGARYSP